jgi:hypothetical protein
MGNGDVSKIQQELDELRMEMSELRERLRRAEEKTRFLEEENRRLSRQRRGEELVEKRCVVIGDSIIKYVGQQKPELRVKAYPGIRIDELKCQMERREEGNPSVIIVHVGSNDLRREVDFIMGDMYDLISATRRIYSEAKIIVSGVLRRKDVHWRKIGRVNEAFEWVAERLGVEFVDPNSWMDDRDFARDGVHLNRRGVVALEELYLRMVASSSGDKDVDQ